MRFYSLKSKRTLRRPTVYDGGDQLHKSRGIIRGGMSELSCLKYLTFTVTMMGRHHNFKRGLFVASWLVGRRDDETGRTSDLRLDLRLV